MGSIFPFAESPRYDPQKIYLDLLIAFDACCQWFEFNSWSIMVFFIEFGPSLANPCSVQQICCNTKTFDLNNWWMLLSANMLKPGVFVDDDEVAVWLLLFSDRKLEKVKFIAALWPGGVCGSFEISESVKTLLLSLEE